MSSWGRRVCMGCPVDLSESEFSSNQWAKGVDCSRCTLGEADTNGPPFAEGAFRFVYRGIYTEGERQGQPLAAKRFKTGATFEDEFFDMELLVVNKALYVLSQLNGANFIEQTIRLNKPEVWVNEWTGEKVLMEPFIEDFTKFNSNTLWVNPHQRGYNDVFQALSHYSYHVSAGQFLLCDIQGGIYREGAVLTDPVIQNQDGRFGPIDLGNAGIATFFANHSCNGYCRADWTRPRDQTAYFAATSSTSMMASAARAKLPGNREALENRGL